MVETGRILRFDEVRGYGFIAPNAGGEDVFVHANDFGDQRHLVHPGMRVEYEVEEGERGLKVATVRILDTPAPPRRDHARAASSTADDDGLCDVLSSREFAQEVTELLIQHVPSLTGSQIAQARQHLVAFARSHGWVES
ncbi:cold shock domain-containing protein [Dactylosporangium sp. AC04546]|uniref:cold shock domain-containing protein n=1 Tax=Dactylosporangium sp. AC04546 TaxID=2862460 RepID=UPI001EDF74DA|nr:cold shock domain-containing protein [Dactylosporangium sp. AC04546]WVK79821.1 cold shock domain-containing protein [Dactylosporangium sp. AC04546]